MKKMKQILALMLAVLMLVPALAACKQNTDETENEATITATPVKFSKSGSYTTTISSNKIKLDGLTSDNVEVRYLDPNEAPADEIKEPTPEKLFSLMAAVDSVKANANGGYDVSFTDKYAADFSTDCYCISLKNINACAYVDVDFPEIALTPDVDSVYFGTERFRVALAISGAEFEDGLSEEDLFFDNAFAKIDCEIVSKSSRNLTLEISGAFTKNEADAYQWGVVGVKSSGIKNGYADVSAKINVKMDYAGFDRSSLSYADGKVTADLMVYGVADVDTLNKDNVTVEGATVEALTKTDDNRVRLSLTVENAASINDFVDFINGKKMTLGAYETEVHLSQATFYPVFDYIEKNGESFDLTLKLYIYGGTVDSTFTADKIALGDEFAGAAVKSVTVDADNLATLVISVPNGGFTEENYQFDGAVTVKAGAVTNAWGAKTSDDYTYSRSYSAESLGREVSLNTDTLLEIQKFTRGQNTTFGNICYWAGNAGTVFNIAKSVLEITGVVKSEHQQVMEQLAVMDQKLDNIQAGITDIKKSIGDLVLLTKVLSREEEKRELKSKIDDFEALLIEFNHTIDVTRAIQKRAALDMALEEAGVTPDYTGMTIEQVATEKERLRKEYLPDVDGMTDKEAAQYNVKVMNYLNAQIADPNCPSEYASYNDYIRDLEVAFKNICSSLDKPVASNPISFYDELCSYTYNFDSQTYDFRLANRVTIQYNLADAISVLAFHFKVAANPDSDRYALIGAAFQKALDSSIWKVSGRPASEIKAKLHIAQQSEARIYISDIKIAGSNTSGEEARQYLIDEGYTVYSGCDLNAGTKKGCYIFLGYKTTEHFDEAISGFYIANKYKESITVDGLGTGYPAPYTGDDFFKGLPGNLNRGCGSNSKGLYLYYFKNTAETKRAVSGIEILKGSSAASRSIPHDSKLTGDLNQGAGGYYVYMCIGTKGVNDGVDVSLVNKMVETDQSYYPYCYTLGCKVSTYVTTQGVNNESTIKKSKNWTVEEINEFFARMKHWYMKDEFRSAGLYIGNSLVFTYEDNWLGKNHCIYIRQIYNDRVITGINNNYIGMNYDWTQGYIYFLMRY